MTELKAFIIIGTGISDGGLKTWSCRDLVLVSDFEAETPSLTGMLYLQSSFRVPVYAVTLLHSRPWCNICIVTMTTTLDQDKMYQLCQNRNVCFCRCPVEVKLV